MLRFDRIEALLKLNNLTQSELLQKAGQSPNNFSRWKSGKATPSWSSVTSLAKVLGVDPAYLNDMTDSPYGGEIIERAMNALVDAGAEIEVKNEDNGDVYFISFKGIKHTYNDVDFKDLCHRLVTSLNDSELFSAVDFCNRTFLGQSFIREDSEFYFTAEERSLIDNFRKLDQEGKIMLQSALISELRRMKK